ncbi:unnamed protein product [Ectocarpus sp. 6 AP-2014]
MLDSESVIGPKTNRGRAPSGDTERANQQKVAQPTTTAAPVVSYSCPRGRVWQIKTKQVIKYRPWRYPANDIVMGERNLFESKWTHVLISVWHTTLENTG